MTRAEQARQAALDRVGDAYVYGAWDQPCTVANRNKYANLKDEYRDAIRNQCQRTKSNKSTCSGCKYEGRRIHDCRGLTSACAAAAGIVIDGSTVARQWNADVWAEKGPIDTLPERPYVQLFRHNGTKWAHTGIYIGNGETVDARGHVYGVIRKKLSDYKWTHWAIPKGMDGEAEAPPAGAAYSTAGEAGGPPFPGDLERADGEEGEGDRVIYSARVTTNGGNLNIRSGPGTEYQKTGFYRNGDKLDVLAVYDTDGDGHPDWAFTGGDGITGYVSMAYLTPIDGPGSAQDATDGGGVQTPTDEEEALSAQDSAQGWGVWIDCDNEEEARRYAGNVKRARIIRIEEPPGEAGGEGE